MKKILPTSSNRMTFAGLGMSNRIAIRSFVMIGMLFVPVVLTSCSSQDNAPDATATPSAAAPQPVVAEVSTADEFGVPSGFKPSYTNAGDENIDISPTWTRRNVRIVVPAGLSKNDVEANTCAAAEVAYEKDGHPNAITVFAYKPNTDTESVYTAGRLIWAPGGDWMRAGESVSVAEHKATFDLSDLYSDAPTGLSAQLKRSAIEEDDAGKKEETPLLRRFSEKRLKTLYYDIEKGIDDQMLSPVVPGDVDASIKANKAAICRQYHITGDQYESIRDVGSERGWPEPE